MTGQPASAAETDAAIRLTFLRLAAQLEATAREAREAAGEDIYGPACGGHGWRDCEDITCRRIAEASATAAGAERERIAQLADRVGASYLGSPDADFDEVSLILLFADLIRGTI